jgi:hypothetical protein
LSRFGLCLFVLRACCLVGLSVCLSVCLSVSMIEASMYDCGKFQLPHPLIAPLTRTHSPLTRIAPQSSAHLHKSLQEASHAIQKNIPMDLGQAQVCVSVSAFLSVAHVSML